MENLESLKVSGFRTRKCTCGCGAATLVVFYEHVNDGDFSYTSYHRFKKFYQANPQFFVKKENQMKKKTITLPEIITAVIVATVGISILLALPKAVLAMLLIFAVQLTAFILTDDETYRNVGSFANKWAFKPYKKLETYIAGWVDFLTAKK